MMMAMVMMKCGPDVLPAAAGMQAAAAASALRVSVKVLDRLPGWGPVRDLVHLDTSACGTVEGGVQRWGTGSRGAGAGANVAGCVWLAVRGCVCGCVTVCDRVCASVVDW